MSAPSYPDCIDKRSFQSGLEFQDFVCTLLMRDAIVLQNTGSKLYQIKVGENLQGFEIKLDRRFQETGRLSIEIAEKSRAEMSDWTPSGIYRDDNTWLYIQGNYQRVYVFPKKFLVSLHLTNRYEIDSTATVQKFYLPLSDAEKYAAKVIDVRWNEGQPLPLRQFPWRRE